MLTEALQSGSHVKNMARATCPRGYGVHIYRLYGPEVLGVRLEGLFGPGDCQSRSVSQRLVITVHFTEA